MMEEFVSMGVAAHFSILWSNLLAWGYQHTLPMYHAFVIDMAPCYGAWNPGIERKLIYSRSE